MFYLKEHQFVGKQVYPISKSNSDHRTPYEFFKALGEFDLDVASSVENHLCEFYFTEEDDGLSQEWIGKRIWCNPPYSNTKKWVQYAIEQCYYQGNCEEVVMLLPARTCTKWFRLIYDHATEISFIHGRLKFSGPHSIGKAPFASMLIRFNRHDSKQEINMRNTKGEII